MREVVNGLMMDRFNDIIDVEFTANMERKLDDVEEGKQEWKQLLAEFYGGFHKEMEEAIRPGMSTMDIDILGDKTIRKLGCIPNFKNYHG